MNAPFLPRVLRSYQQRAATYLYERDAAFLIAPLGAGKGAAALTAIAELIRDGHRRHADVNAARNLIQRRSLDNTGTSRASRDALLGALVSQHVARYNRPRGRSADPRLSNPYFRSWAA